MSRHLAKQKITAVSYRIWHHIINVSQFHALYKIDTIIVYLPLLSTIVTVAWPGSPTVILLLFNEDGSMIRLNVSLPSSTLSSITETLNETLVVSASNLMMIVSGL